MKRTFGRMAIYVFAYMCARHQGGPEWASFLGALIFAYQALPERD